VGIRTSLVQRRTPDAALLGAVPAVLLGGVGTIAVALAWAWPFPEVRRAGPLER